MEAYRRDFEALRKRTNDALNRLQKIQTGTAATVEASAIHGEVREVEAQAQGLEAAYKRLAPQIDQGEARQLDEQLRYLRSRVQSLKVNYQQYTQQGRREIEVDEADFQGGVNQAQDLKQRKDQQIDHLNEQAKVLKQQNLLINEKLTEGDEIIKDLHGDVNNARDSVQHSTGKVQQFQAYLKKNKAPFWSCLGLMVLSVFIWSTKAFCSIGLTWQCP